MAVEVLGINPKTSVYMLELFFENTRKCGGGEIKQLLFDQDKHTAIIWFEDENVSHRCQEFCTTSNVELENYPLTVKIYKGLESVAEVPAKEKLRNATTAKPRQTQRIAVDPTTSHGHSGAGARGPARRDGRATGQRDGRATGQRDGRATGQRDAISSRPDLERSQLAEYDFCTVELSNIPVETTRDYLQLVVESVFPEVGDTAIKEFNYADGDQRGWIKLRRKEDAHEIVMSSPLDVDGTPVHVVPLNTLLEDDPDYQGSAAIRVTNIPDGVSNQHIKLLFKNQKRTGGGAIADIYSEKGIVCITYEESCVAKAVLERHNKKLLQCKGQTLAIERLCPVPPPPLCLGQKECTRLLLTALPDFITGSDITKFLNPDGGCDVSTILFSCKPGVALVVFVGSPDYEALLWRCGTRPLKGTMVSIQEIPLPRHIQVHGLQSLDTEIVELYFEDEADVVNSYISSDKTWMIIQFSNPEAVMRTTKHKHELEDVLMKVEVYYPDFGEYPPGVDMTQPLPERHATITLTTGGPVGRFIFKSPQAIDYLNDQLKPVNATLQLDSSSEEQLTLLCLSTVAASEIKLWKDTATNRFEDLLADTFEARDLALDGELYQHVSREAHKHARKHRLVITTDDDSKTIALVGWKKEVRDAEASLSQQCQAIEDEKSADKCVIPVRREDALLLSASDFSTTIANTFARLSVTIGEEGVILHGPTRYMSDAKVKMYEDYIRKKTSRDEVTSPDVLNLLQMDNAANRVRAALAEAEVCVAWHITDGKLTLIALNEDALDTAMSVVKGSVVSKKRELDPAESAAVQTHVWKDLIQSLEKAHKGLLVFNHGPQEVRWACVKDIAEIIEAVVNDYLAEHVIHEELVPADPGVVEVLDQYGDVRSVAKQTNVKLESRWEVPQGAGFLIKGTRADLEAGRKRIKECIFSVVNKDLVLNAVRDFRFIKSPKCELVLADLRSMYRCAIRVVKEGGDPERAADEADNEDSLEDSSIASSVFLLPANDAATLRLHGLSAQSLHRAIKTLLQHITSAMRTEVIGEEDQVALSNLTDEDTANIYGIGERFFVEIGLYSEGGKTRLKISGLQDEVFPAMAEVSTLLKKVEQRTKDNETLKRMALAKYVIYEELVPADPGVVEVLDQYGDVRSVAKQANVKLESRWEDPQGAGFLIKGTRADLETGRKMITECISTVVNKDLVLHTVQEIRFIKSQKCELTLENLRSMYKCAIRVVKEGGDPEKAADEADNEDSLEDSSIASSGSGGEPTSRPNALHTFTTKEGLHLSLSVGMLEKEKAQVLINTTQRDLNLQAGAVSAAILREAGQSVQRECYEKCPRGLRLGAILHTNPGRLQANYIFHGEFGDLTSRNISSNLKIMKDMLRKCLDLADQKGQKSLATPAIGTGGFGPSPKDCAKVMNEVVQDFSKRNPKTSLKDIRIILHPNDKDTIKAYVDTLSNVTPPAPPAPNRVRRMLKSRSPTDGAKSLASPMFLLPANDDVTLRLHGLSWQSIHRAINSLYQHIRSAMRTEVIGEEDQVALSNLTDEDIAKIYGVGEKFYVEMQLYSDDGENRLKISGLQDEVFPAMNEVSKLLRKVEEHVKDERQIQWEVSDDGEVFTPYDIDIGAIIEKAYRAKMPYAEWEGEDCKYRIDLDKMVEETVGGAGKPVPVRRRDTTVTDTLPQSWTVSVNPASVRRFDLQPTSSEYQQVEQQFKVTVTTGTIQKIERIQNASLYKQYDIHKTRVDADNPAGHTNERILYFGRTIDYTVDKINRKGFDRSFRFFDGLTCIILGAWKGIGAYFTRDAADSLQCSWPDANGIRYIYQCRVLTGEYSTRSFWWEGPPRKPGKSAAVLFDSVVDNVATPSYFVIFYDNQAYPEYLIHYKE